MKKITNNFNDAYVLNSKAHIEQIRFDLLSQSLFLYV